MWSQRIFIWLAILAVTAAVLLAQTLNTAKIDTALGRSGQQNGGVYRITFLRTDLQVRTDGVDIKPGLALGSWAAFSGTEKESMVMGDLVLLENEVNPVVRKLRSSGIEITAIHNHLMDETPRILYVHYMGHGNASDLAKSLRDALSESKTPLGVPSPAQASEPPAFVKTIEDMIGAKGKWSGGVLSFGIPRADQITDEGVTLTSAQGVAESINFQDAGAEKVATTGDFVLTADEVNPVISALAQHNIQVTALHSHLLTEQPRLFFMHFWGVGSPAAVSLGIKAGLDKVHLK